jgi:hypothetical protein
LNVFRENKEGFAVLFLTFVCLGVFFSSLVFYFIHYGRAKSFRSSDILIHGDGVYYYSFTRSLFFDRDLDTTNEYLHYWGETKEKPLWKTVTGKNANFAPIGSALLWLPWMLLGHMLAKGFNLLGWGLAVDGYSYPYEALVCLGSAFYGFLGIFFSYLVSRDYFSQRISLLSAISIWFATSVVAYMTIYISMAHMSSLFAVALFIYLWQRQRGNRDLSNWIALGLSGGLMTLVRTENIIFSGLLLADLIGAITNRRGEKDLKKIWLGIGIAFFLLVIVLLPQFLAWKSIYGSYLAIPYREAGGRFEPTLSWISKSLINSFKLLFSSRHGLFIWTPITILSILGSIQLCRRAPELGWPYLSLFLIFVLFYGSWSCWWGGHSFGARFLIKCTPIFVLGLAALMEVLEKRISFKPLPLIGGLFIGWNFLMIVQYSTNMISRDDYVPMRELFLNQFRLIGLIF